MKTWSIIFIVIIGIILVIVFAVDPLAERWINHRLNQTSALQGKVNQVDVKLWQAAVHLEGIEIFHPVDSSTTPLFTADSLTVDLRWKPLFRQTLVGDIFLANPVFNYIMPPPGGKPDSTQSSNPNLPDFTVQQLEIIGGKVHVKDVSTNPPLTASIRDLQITGENISNRQQTSALPASLQVNGNTTGNGQLSLTMEMDLLPDQPEFTSDLAIDSIHLPELNDFFQVYTGVSMNGGRLSLSSELEVDSGRIDGYILPNFKNIDVVAFGEDANAGDGIFNKTWEVLAGIGMQLVQNTAAGPQESLGRIPIHLKLREQKKNQQASIFESIGKAVSQALDAEIGKQSETPS